MRALIVLGGDLPDEALMRCEAEKADFTIAADKGLAAFDRCGLFPDLLVGDMDSVPQNVLARYEGHVQERRLPCVKDDTDGVDALDMAIARGAKHIVLLGALGGRLDHAMANLMLLVRAARQGVFAEICDEKVRIFRVADSAVLLDAVGDTFSVLPMGEATGVSLSGCYYPLRNGTLTSDYPLGMSNVVTEREAKISVQNGDLICFHWYGVRI